MSAERAELPGAALRKEPAAPAVSSRYAADIAWLKGLAAKASNTQAAPGPRLTSSPAPGTAHRPGSVPLPATDHTAGTGKALLQPRARRASQPAHSAGTQAQAQGILPSRPTPWSPSGPGRHPVLWYSNGWYGGPRASSSEAGSSSRDAITTCPTTANNSPTEGSGYVARSRPGSPTAHLQPVSHTLHSGPQKHAHSSDTTHSRLSHDIRPPTPPRLARRAALGSHATDRRPQSPHARHRRSLSAPATRASSPVHSTAFTSPTKHSSRGRSVSPGVGVTQGYQSSHKSPRSIAGLARRATHETYMYPSHSKSLSSPSQAQGVQSFRLGAVLGGHTAGSLGAQGAGRTGAAGGGVNGLANRPVTAPTAGHIGYAGSQLLSPRAEARSRSPGSPHKAEAAQAAPSVQCQDSTIATHGSAAVPQAAPTLQHQDNTIATRGSDVPPPAGATPLSEQLVTGVVSSHPVEEPSDAGTASTSGSDADHTAPQACVQPPAAAVAAAVSTPAQPVGASHSATATVAAAPAHLTVQQPSRMAVATPPVSAAEGAWQRWAAQWQGSRSPAAATAAAAVTANTSPAAAHSQGTPTAAHRGPAAAAMHVNHSPTAATATAAEQRAASPSIRSALSAPAPHSVAAGVHSNTAQSSSAVTAEAAAATAAATAAPAARSLSPIRALRRLFSPQPRHQPDHPTSPHHASETPQSLQGAHAATAHAGNSPQLVGSSVQLSAAVSSAMASGYRPLAPGQYITGRAMLTQHPWHAIQRTSPLHMPRSPHTPHTQPFGAAHVGNGQQGGACDYARGRVVHARSDAGASEGAHAAAPRAARGRSAPPELRAHALESIKEVCSSDSEAGDTPRTSNDTHHIHTTHHHSDPHRGDTQHSGYRSEGGMGQSQRPVRPDRRGVWSPVRPGPEGASRDARAYNASALRTREGLVRGRSASPQGWRPGGTHAHSHSPARSVNQPPLPPVATISSGRSTVRGTTRPGSAGGAAAAPGLWSPQALHGSLHWDARTMPRPGSAGTRAVSRSAHVSPTRSSTPYTTTQLNRSTGVPGRILRTAQGATESRDGAPMRDQSRRPPGPTDAELRWLARRTAKSAQPPGAWKPPPPPRTARSPSPGGHREDSAYSPARTGSPNARPGSPASPTARYDRGSAVSPRAAGRGSPRGHAHVYDGPAAYPLSAHTSHMQPSAHALSAHTSHMQPGAHALSAHTSHMQPGAHALSAHTSHMQPGAHALSAHTSPVQPGAHALSAHTSHMQPGAHALSAHTSHMQPSAHPVKTVSFGLEVPAAATAGAAAVAGPAAATAAAAALIESYPVLSSPSSTSDGTTNDTVSTNSSTVDPTTVQRPTAHHAATHAARMQHGAEAELRGSGDLWSDMYTQPPAATASSRAAQQQPQGNKPRAKLWTPFRASSEEATGTEAGETGSGVVGAMAGGNGELPAGPRVDSNRRNVTPVSARGSLARRLPPSTHVLPFPAAADVTPTLQVLLGDPSRPQPPQLSARRTRTEPCTIPPPATTSPTTIFPTTTKTLTTGTQTVPEGPRAHPLSGSVTLSSEVSCVSHTSHTSHSTATDHTLGHTSEPPSPTGMVTQAVPGVLGIDTAAGTAVGSAHSQAAQAGQLAAQDAALLGGLSELLAAAEEAVAARAVTGAAETAQLSPQPLLQIPSEVVSEASATEDAFVALLTSQQSALGTDAGPAQPVLGTDRSALQRAVGTGTGVQVSQPVYEPPRPMATTEPPVSSLVAQSRYPLPHTRHAPSALHASHTEPDAGLLGAAGGRIGEQVDTAAVQPAVSLGRSITSVPTGNADTTAGQAVGPNGSASGPSRPLAVSPGRPRTTAVSAWSSDDSADTALAVTRQPSGPHTHSPTPPRRARLPGPKLSDGPSSPHGGAAAAGTQPQQSAAAGAAAEELQLLPWLLLPAAALLAGQGELLVAAGGAAPQPAAAAQPPSPVHDTVQASWAQLQPQPPRRQQPKQLQATEPLPVPSTAAQLQPAQPAKVQPRQVQLAALPVQPAADAVQPQLSGAAEPTQPQPAAAQAGLGSPKQPQPQPAAQPSQPQPPQQQPQSSPLQPKKSLTMHELLYPRPQPAAAVAVTSPPPQRPVPAVSAVETVTTTTRAAEKPTAPVAAGLSLRDAASAVSSASVPSPTPTIVLAPPSPPVLLPPAPLPPPQDAETAQLPLPTSREAERPTPTIVLTPPERTPAAAQSATQAAESVSPRHGVGAPELSLSVPAQPGSQSQPQPQPQPQPVPFPIPDEVSTQEQPRPQPQPQLQPQPPQSQPQPQDVPTQPPQPQPQQLLHFPAPDDVFADMGPPVFALPTKPHTTHTPDTTQGRGLLAEREVDSSTLIAARHAAPAAQPAASGDTAGLHVHAERGQTVDLVASLLVPKGEAHEQATKQECGDTAGLPAARGTTVKLQAHAELDQPAKLAMTAELQAHAERGHDSVAVGTEVGEITAEGGAHGQASQQQCQQASTTQQLACDTQAAITNALLAQHRLIMAQHGSSNVQHGHGTLVSHTTVPIEAQAPITSVLLAEHGLSMSQHGHDTLVSHGLDVGSELSESDISVARSRLSRMTRGTTRSSCHTLTLALPEEHSLGSLPSLSPRNTTQVPTSTTQPTTTGRCGSDNMCVGDIRGQKSEGASRRHTNDSVTISVTSPDSLKCDNDESGADVASVGSGDMVWVPRRVYCRSTASSVAAPAAGLAAAVATAVGTVHTARSSVSEYTDVFAMCEDGSVGVVSADVDSGPGNEAANGSQPRPAAGAISHVPASVLTSAQFVSTPSLVSVQRDVEKASDIAGRVLDLSLHTPRHDRTRVRTPTTAPAAKTSPIPSNPTTKSTTHASPATATAVATPSGARQGKKAVAETVARGAAGMLIGMLGAGLLSGGGGARPHGGSAVRDRGVELMDDPDWWAGETVVELSGANDRQVQSLSRRRQRARSPGGGDLLARDYCNLRE